MAYDVALAERIAKLLKGKKRVAQKQMFGGICFLVNGKMCCGVTGKKLVARVGPEGTTRRWPGRTGSLWILPAAP